MDAGSGVVAVVTFLKNRGCLKIPLIYGSLTHIVLSSAGITFHWKEGKEHAREVLAKITNKLGLNSIKGDSQHHDWLHFDLDEDARYPELHGHFLINLLEEGAEDKMLRILAKLLKHNHLLQAEYDIILRGIKEFKVWISASDSDSE
jgi:hypothetical protein